MFEPHFLVPEKLWGVFNQDGYCVALFATHKEAREYCDRHNAQG